MDTDATPQTPPQHWLDALERGEADRAAGRVAPWPAVRETLTQALAAMERGADTAEQERLLLALDALEDDSHEDAPRSLHR